MTMTFLEEKELLYAAIDVVARVIPRVARVMLTDQVRPTCRIEGKMVNELYQCQTRDRSSNYPFDQPDMIESCRGRI